ncbi:MAG TPA: DUF2723 domain-containing protein [Chloroflexia bacterium]|nr:DUF2723 domain-containing protein [Chloroflexia bacterium]
MMLQRLAGSRTRITWLAGALLFLGWLAVYLSTVSPTVNFIDSGELIAAAYEPGIAHAPGYPLYVLLGFVTSHLLWGEIAWRVNVLSAFWGAMAVAAMFSLLIIAMNYLEWLNRPKSAPTARRRKPAKSPSPRPPGKEEVEASDTKPVSRWLLYIAAALSAASLFAASATFWSRTAQAKMYTLHYFFVLASLTAALQYRWAYERGGERAARRWLLLLSAGLGLSFTNHLMTMLLGPGVLALLVMGGDWQRRFRVLLRQLPLILPAFLLPLLLYAYLPLRASQGPVMNWGSTNYSFGDFWRHISGWQYQAYLFQDVRGTFVRIIEFIFGQWGLLTWLIWPLCIAGGVLLARRSLPLFVATAATAAMTFIFALTYGISEIEPYMVPFYAMLVFWLGAAAITLRLELVQRATKDKPEVGNTGRIVAGATALLAVLALVSGIAQYPRQDLSDNRLAEQFVENAFRSLPQNSIVLTDYWDFYAPTYYLQGVMNRRPDLAIVNISLLQYPWYTGQLRLKYPWLIEESQDILARYSPEQRKWVNGEPFDGALLDGSYYELLASFVERHYDERPTYSLFVPCPKLDCRSVRVLPEYIRAREGIVHRFWRDTPPASYVPPEPQYELRGITHDKVPFDDFARENTDLYLDSYRELELIYRSLNQPEMADRMAAQASEIAAAIEGR